MKNQLVMMLPVVAAACSGGGSDSDLYGDYRGEFLRTTDYLELISPTLAVPTTGTATYNGIATLGPDTDVNDLRMGDLSLQVDFADDSLTGEATDFIRVRQTGPSTATGDRIDGSLTYTSDTVGFGVFDVEMSGELEFGGTMRSVSGTLGTTLYGGSATAIAGATFDAKVAGKSAPWIAVIVAD